MAKKRKKRASFGALKYEVYGILIITLSVIAISGEAAVGRALSKLFGFMLGKFYFVIPLMFIYIGLYVMVKRTWPKAWSVRKSGLAVIVLALTTLSVVSSVDAKFAALETYSSSDILRQVGTDLKGELLTTNKGVVDGSIMKKDISGGYAGAIGYAILYFLFGYTGAKLMVIVMFFIGFMLITGLSYVDMTRIVKNRLAVTVKLIRERRRRSMPQRSGSAARNGKAGKPVLVAANMADDDEMDEENYKPEPAKPKKMPIFMQLLQGKPEAERELDEEEAVEALVGMDEPPQPRGKRKQRIVDQEVEPTDDNTGIRVAIRGGADKSNADVDAMPAAIPAIGTNPTYAQHDPTENEDNDGFEHGDNFYDRGPEIPVIRDFHEQIRSDVEVDDTLPPFDVEPGTPGEQETIHVAADAELTDTVDGEGEGNVVVAPPKPKPKPYQLPSLQLLNKPSGSGSGGDQSDFRSIARKLEATLESFGVRAKVLEVVRGPSVTRYEVQPDIGVKVSRIVSLTDDIALALAAKDIRMEAPIPGKSAIGIEVPNSEVSIVTLREVMETGAFQDAPSRLSIAFGRDISGQPIVGNLARMPHMLVAGATGSGKSVCINGIITSILYKAKPDEVKFLMIDPKMVELNVYNGIPHLLAPVVTDPKRASLALKKIVVEMEKRYELFSKSGTRNIEGYNTLMASNPDAVLPYIVIIVDELADLMMVAAGDVEDAICRLAQMARAAGIHLIIATQRPSVDVITGVIKANIPSRVAFGVSSQVDSRTILDMVGAEKLLGRGDMLFLPMGASKPVRVQGAFLSDQEVEAVVQFARDQEKAEYNEELVPEVEETEASEDEYVDELYDQAVQIVLEAKQASVSLLQRRMRIGYTRAARLIDSMEAKGVVGPYEGSKPREVLVSADQYYHNRISS